MSAEKLAFLQNFYTDVTLYVPTEPEPVVPTVAVVPTVTMVPEAVVPAVAAGPAAPARATPGIQRAPGKPTREVQLPSTGYSHPSAGLERLASGYVHPQAPTALPTGATPALINPIEQAAATNAPRVAARPLPTAQLPAAEPAIAPVLLTRFATLGSNPQGVVLLFRLPQEQFLKLHRNVFLNKMLQALDLVMADVVLVNVESDLPVALINLRRELATTHVVAFGKNLLDTTIRNTQIYEPVLFTSLNLAYLASATVDLVEYDVSLKKRLWPGLQRMFGKA